MIVNKDPADLIWPDDFINKIICGDCLDVMKKIPDGAVDLVLTDPPYGGIVGGYDRTPTGGIAKRTKKSEAIGQIWKPNQWHKGIALKAKDGLVIFCSHRDVDEIPTHFPDLRKVCLFTWREGNAPPTGKNVPRFTTQFAWVLSCGGGYDFGSIKKTDFDYPHQPGGCMKTDRPNHPCPKPPKLMRDMVGQFSCNLILDPFLGSGTTAVAAKQLGRRFIGIEINMDYCKIAEDRLRQRELF